MRVMWVICMIAGCIVFGGLAALNIWGFIQMVVFKVEDPLPFNPIRAALLFGLSGGFAAMAGMKPSEAKRVMDEEDAPRAAWLDEMQKNQPPKQDS